MSLAESGNNEHVLNHDYHLLVAQKETDVSRTFLGKFAGDWASTDARETRPISPPADKGYRCPSTSHSRQLADDAAPSVVAEEESPCHTSTNSNPRKRYTASSELGVKSNPETNREKAAADAPGTSNALSVGNAVLAYSSVRKLSSTTSFRRMHLSRDDAVALFPEIKNTMDFVFITDTKRCQSPEYFKVDIAVSLQDEEGRHWPIMLECLRSAGQRHVRLNKGWAEMSRAIGISVGKRIRLARWEHPSSSNDALITLSVV